jgi:16S rRNA (cytosine967-C5)-methyltransferase
LVTNLVYGVLRNRLFLDYLLKHFLRQSPESLDLPVLTILRLGAYEQEFLSTPAFASVNAYVELSKKGPAKKARGLINACLRGLDRGRQKVKLPSADKSFNKWLSLSFSHPLWLVDELVRLWGEKEAQKWCEANQEKPAATIRVNTLKTSPRVLMGLLAEHVKDIKTHPLDPHVLVLIGLKGGIMSLPGFEEGFWQAQDPAATCVTRLLGVEPGMRVLDLCAGAGGKSGHLAELMKNQGQLVCADPSAGRIKALKENLARLGVKKARVIKAEAAKLDAGQMLYDRILRDAPCSGLGVIGRRPDLRWRRSSQDAKRLAELQSGILAKAGELLSPGGALVYCTCTMMPGENMEVVEAFMQKHPEFFLDPAPDEYTKKCWTKDGFFQTLPHRQKSDAFFAARLSKK